MSEIRVGDIRAWLVARKLQMVVENCELELIHALISGVRTGLRIGSMLIHAGQTQFDPELFAILTSQESFLSMIEKARSYTGLKFGAEKFCILQFHKHSQYAEGMKEGLMYCFLFFAQMEQTGAKLSAVKYQAELHIAAVEESMEW